MEAETKAKTRLEVWLTNVSLAGSHQGSPLCSIGYLTVAVQTA
jgi:hypothetical protein